MSKHLNLSQRIEIERNLNGGKSLRQIAKIIGKPHTTISREIQTRKVSQKGNYFNSLNMKCDKTEKAPFVCNGCPNKSKCRKNKYFYFTEDANNNYKKILIESREGIDFENVEFRKMDNIIKEEIDTGHSFYMIVQDHPEFNITESSLYYYQKKGYYQLKILTYQEKLDIKKK